MNEVRQFSSATKMHELQQLYVFIMRFSVIWGFRNLTAFVEGLFLSHFHCRLSKPKKIVICYLRHISLNMKIFKLAGWEVPSTSIQGNEWKLAWRSPSVPIFWHWIEAQKYLTFQNCKWGVFKSIDNISPLPLLWCYVWLTSYINLVDMGWL